MSQTLEVTFVGSHVLWQSGTINTVPQNFKKKLQFKIKINTVPQMRKMAAELGRHHEKKAYGDRLHVAVLCSV
jgi:hypothetical protein